jgi:hypothetical protein
MNLIRIFAVAVCVSQLVQGALLNAAERGRAGHRAHSTLVVDMPPLEFIPVKNLKASTAHLLTVATSMPAYECRLSGEALNAHIPHEINIAAPFRDVIVQAPVAGQATTKGKLWVESIPNDNEINLVVHVAGTTIMNGVSTSRGVGVSSATETTFHVTKPLTCDANQVRTAASQCRASTKIAINGVSTSHQRLAGRIAKRVGYRKAMNSVGAAEAETNAHVAGVLKEYVDEQIDKLVAQMNTSIRDHLATLDRNAREEWARVQFCSTKDGCRITRNGNALQTAEVEQRHEGHIVLILPRRNISYSAAIGLLAVGKLQPTDGETPASDNANADKAAKPMIDWRPELVVVTLDRFPG